MVKVRKNHQPRDWQEQTHARSHGGMLTGRQKFIMTSIKPESEFSVLSQKIKKLTRRAKRFSDKVAQAHGTLLEAEYRYQLQVTETILFQAMMNMERIKRKDESYFKGLETREENLQKEMRAKIENMERAEKFRGNNHKREFVFPNRNVMVEHVENRKGRRKLVKKYSIKLADKLEKKRI